MATIDYNAVGEIFVSPTERRVDGWLDALADYHPAIGHTARGGSEVIITVPADNLGQAISTARAVLFAALGQVDALHVMTTEEFDRRTGDVPIPDMVGATDAAAILGVTRQRVQQMGAAGLLPSTKVGNSLAFPRSAVEAERARQEQRLEAARLAAERAAGAVLAGVQEATDVVRRAVTPRKAAAKKSAR